MRVSTHEQLIREIDAHRTPPGEIALWWLGQLGFVVKAGGSVLYVDAYLSARAKRQVAPLLRPEEVTNATLILGSHDHLDHIDRSAWPPMAVASPQAKFVVPAILLPRLAQELGIAPERFLGLDDGRTVEHAGVRITAIPAAHEFLDRDEASGQYPYLGFVIHANGATLYHSGDTCLYEGMSARLRNIGIHRGERRDRGGEGNHGSAESLPSAPSASSAVNPHEQPAERRLDAMLLPINGRDAARLARGCIGNMTYQESADLAGPLGPGLVVPGHWDMFADNPGDPEAFAAYMHVKYPDVPVHIPAHGVRFDVKALVRLEDETDIADAEAALAESDERIP